MIARHLHKFLSESARWYPVISLTGPRQSGKTTLARAVFSTARCVSLEDPAQRQLALGDARGFLEQLGSEQVILDEAQHVPERLAPPPPDAYSDSDG